LISEAHQTLKIGLSRRGIPQLTRSISYEVASVTKCSLVPTLNLRKLKKVVATKRMPPSPTLLLQKISEKCTILSFLAGESLLGVALLVGSYNDVYPHHLEGLLDGVKLAPSEDGYGERFLALLMPIMRSAPRDDFIRLLTLRLNEL